MSLRSINPRLLPHFQAISRPNHQYGLKQLYDAEACQQVVDALDLKAKYPNSAGNLDIVDVFSGYGLFSTMVNHELKPRNHIVIEDTKDNVAIWQSRLQFLQKNTANVENFQFHELNGHAWETYDRLFKQMKVVAPAVQPRTQVHDELLILGNLTSNKFGESLFAQWIRCCADRNWLQKYGRVRMVLLVREATTQKFLSGPNFPKRNRLALKRDIYTDSRLVAVSDTPDSHTVCGDGYDPNLLVRDQPLVLPMAVRGGDMTVVEVVPKDLGSMVVSDVDYLAQVLMYKSTNSVRDGLTILAPGAKDDLEPKLPDYILNKTARQLSADDVAQIYTAYRNWAFRPSFEETLNFFTEETRTF